jgi:CDP-glucose 4,6-dehydratase
MYKNKKVLVTGNTGFKGSWLTLWLSKLGANVIGYSKNIPTKPSNYSDLGLTENIKTYWEDVTNYEQFKKVIVEERPEFIFHLAAQAIVSESYINPIETIQTNTIGIVNLMDILKDASFSCSVVIVTSDKCYENQEWIWGYRETDNLGGKDVYSGSKGAAEVLYHSYHESFYNEKHLVKSATVRAGNVIGGGDWSKDRIVVDAIKAWNLGDPVNLRSPDATRPWQHVLEPLSGYLLLGLKLKDGLIPSGNAFNFGPKSEKNASVLGLISELSNFFPLSNQKNHYVVSKASKFQEANLLKLNCDKALAYLNWEPTLDYETCVHMVGSWYSAYQAKNVDMKIFTEKQIDTYVAIAHQKIISWA